MEDSKSQRAEREGVLSAEAVLTQVTAEALRQNGFTDEGLIDVCPPDKFEIIEPRTEWIEQVEQIEAMIGRLFGQYTHPIAPELHFYEFKPFVIVWTDDNGNKQYTEEMTYDQHIEGYDFHLGCFHHPPSRRIFLERSSISSIGDSEAMEIDVEKLSTAYIHERLHDIGVRKGNDPRTGMFHPNSDLVHTELDEQSVVTAQAIVMHLIGYNREGFVPSLLDVRDQNDFYEKYLEFMGKFKEAFKDISNHLKVEIHRSLTIDYPDSIVIDDATKLLIEARLDLRIQKLLYKLFEETTSSSAWQAFLDFDNYFISTLIGESTLDYLFVRDEH